MQSPDRRVTVHPEGWWRGWQRTAPRHLDRYQAVGGTLCRGRALPYMGSVPLVGWLWMCVHMACACIFVRGFKGTIRQCTFSFLSCENGKWRHASITASSVVRKLRATCQTALILPASFFPLLSLTSHLLSSPPFLFSPCCRPCLKVVFPGSAKPLLLLQNKNKERGGGQRLSLSGYVSCLKMLLYDISGRFEPTINPPNIA